MAFKKQLDTLKSNWLFLVILVVIIVAVSAIGNVFTDGGYYGGFESLSAPEAVSYDMERGAYYGNSDFAPEVEERVIVKTASLSTKVERGTFSANEATLKSIITASDSFLLNEDVSKVGVGRKQYYRGYYQIKVETSKYGSVIEQLKAIGEVQSFNEDSRDVTGSYIDLQDRLELEKKRLGRYKQMYDEAKDISDRIELNDRIFNQERTIKYLEDSIANIDKRVDYSQVSFTVTEKRSEYSNIVFLKLSDLAKGIVNSVKALIILIVYVLPWIVAIWIIALIVKLFKKKRRRR